MIQVFKEIKLLFSNFQEISKDKILCCYMSHRNIISKKETDLSIENAMRKAHLHKPL